MAETRYDLIQRRRLFASAGDVETAITVAKAAAKETDHPVVVEECRVIMIVRPDGKIEKDPLTIRLLAYI
jgi:hypothetical protein